MRDLNELLELCKEYLDAIDIPYGNITSIKRNNRLKVVFGRCRHFGAYYENGQRMYRRHEIEISGTLFNDNVTEKVIISTLIHEILHSCNGCQNHGALFHKYASLVNDCYDMDIDIKASAERSEKVRQARIEANDYAWIFTCTECGKSYRYNKMPQWVRYGYEPNEKICMGAHCPCSKEHNLKIVKHTKTLYKCMIIDDI